MKKLTDLIKRLKSFESSLVEIMEGVIRANEDIVMEMNSEDQLFDRGVNRRGEKIADYAPYSAFTVELKKMKGQPTSRVTLRDEGDFHFSFYIDYQPDGFEIRSKDWKERDLTDKYGEEILGLTDENFEDIKINYVAEAVINKLRTLGSTL